MLKIGLLGCGNIASIIAKHKIGVEIVAVFDKSPEKAHLLAQTLGTVKTHSVFNEFIKDKFDIVVEAASILAVQDYAEETLKHGKDLIILSVGAFADTSFRLRLEKLAHSENRIIRIPSGALFGLDNLKIARISDVELLTLRSTKPPSSFQQNATTKTLLFKGSAQDCIKLYPKNINVAMALSLAADMSVEVELWIDLDAKRNIHEVIIAGEFGEATITVQNVPSPDNPATSYLAALSIITLLKDLENPFVIGT